MYGKEKKTLKECTQVWIESNVFRHLIACLLQLNQNAL